MEAVDEYILKLLCLIIIMENVVLAFEFVDDYSG